MHAPGYPQPPGCPMFTAGVTVETIPAPPLAKGPHVLQPEGYLTKKDKEQWRYRGGQLLLGTWLVS